MLSSQIELLCGAYSNLVGTLRVAAWLTPITKLLQYDSFVVCTNEELPL